MLEHSAPASSLPIAGFSARTHVSCAAPPRFRPSFISRRQLTGRPASIFITTKNRSHRRAPMMRMLSFRALPGPSRHRHDSRMQRVRPRWHDIASASSAAAYRAAAASLPPAANCRIFGLLAVRLPARGDDISLYATRRRCSSASSAAQLLHISLPPMMPMLAFTVGHGEWAAHIRCYARPPSAFVLFHSPDLSHFLTYRRFRIRTSDAQRFRHI